jgi:hypothetical protein
MTGVPERDPLADLVARSVGMRVDAVVAETLAAPDGYERRRLRYTTTAGQATAIFERAPRGVVLEAQLLPFLARKTDRVPVVHSRGLPPPHASLGPWVLIEDILGAPPGCDGDPADVLRAKLAIERAIATDLPALRALGVRQDRVEGALASAPIGLVHGALACASAHRSERGVVIVDWSHAFLGPTALDAASLIADLRRRGDPEGAARVREHFVDAGGRDAEADLVIAEEKFS